MIAACGSSYMSYRLCFCSLAKAGWQPTHLSKQTPVGAAEGCDLLICFGF
jgi:hypothetical protein